MFPGGFSVVPLELDAFLATFHRYAGFSIEHLREQYRGRRLLGIRRREELVAVFCMSRGPGLRSPALFPDPALARRALGDTSDCVEVVALSIAPHLRAGPVSLACWALAVREVLRTGAPRLVVVTVEPGLAHIYLSLGLEPVFVQDIDYGGETKTGRLFVIPCARLPWLTARSLTRRGLRWLWRGAVRRAGGRGTPRRGARWPPPTPRRPSR